MTDSKVTLDRRGFPIVKRDDLQVIKNHYQHYAMSPEEIMAQRMARLGEMQERGMVQVMLQDMLNPVEISIPRNPMAFPGAIGYMEVCSSLSPFDQEQWDILIQQHENEQNRASAMEEKN